MEFYTAHNVYLSHTFAWLIKVNILSILAVHAHGLLGGFTFLILFEFELSHAVKQLG